MISDTAMQFEDLPETRDSFLARYAIPPMSFESTEQLGASLRPVWHALYQREFSRARDLSLEQLASVRAGAVDHRAAIHVALAAAAFGTGKRKRAISAAEESIALLPRQWAAHRLLMQIYWAAGEFENGYVYLSTLLDPGRGFAWDEPLSAVERHLAIAALAWRLQDWDGVCDHLGRAYPGGAAAMPICLREDAFRLAVYRDQPDDASAAAEALLAAYPLREIDIMVRTIDARGWSDHALNLYRIAYRRHNGSQLLRRRLVGLCIRQGCVEEARSLTDGSALDLAA